MKKGILIVFLIAAMTGLIDSQATAGKGKMRGIVLDETTGQPLEGVTVKLFCVRAVTFHNTFPKTDAEGKWNALYLRGGAWNIDFEKEGYETKKISVAVDTFLGAKINDIEIKLKKVEGITMSEKVVLELEKGNALFTQKQYEQAIAKYLEISKEYPDLFIINKNIGNCYFAMESYPLAIECYLKVYEKLPKNAEIIVLIANSYNNSKNNEKAMEWYNKLNIDEIKDTITLYNIGISYYNAAKYDEAIPFFKKATEIDPEFADAFYQMGMTLTAQNKNSEAVEALKKFMVLAPDSPNFQIAKAVVDALSKTK